MGARLRTAVILLTTVLVAPAAAPGQDHCIDYADYPLNEAQLAIPGTTFGMDADGGHLYLAAHDRGLQVVDLSDPNAPVKISSWNSPGESYDVTVTGGLAYLADGSQGLQIIDISDPGAPVPVGGVDTLGLVRSVEVVGNLAYLAAGWGSGGLFVIDISDPSQPVQMGYAPAGGDARDVALQGGYAYVADFGGFIHVYDVSDPASVQQVATVPTAGEPLALDIAAGVMAVACRSDGLQVFDLSDPALPQATGIVQAYTYTSSLPVLASVLDVRIQDARALIVTGSYQGAVVDLTDPGQPLISTYLPLADAPERVAVDGPLFFASLGDAGVQVLQHGDLDLPEPVGTHSSVQSFTSGPFTVRSDFAYIAGTHLEIVDIGYHIQPIRVNTVYPGSEVHDVAISGNHLYVMVHQYNAIQVYNLANPIHPQLIHAYNTAGGTPHRLAAYGDYLYSGPHNGYLGISDISDPSSAGIITYDDSFSSACQALVIADGRLYVGDQSMVRILDLADPAAPVQVGTISAPDRVRGVTVTGDRAYVATEGHGLDIVDLADADHPVLGHFPASTLEHVTVHAEIAYLSDREAGLWVVDISDETAPRLLGVKRGGCFQTRVVGEHLLAAGSGLIGGMEYLPLQCDGISPVADLPAPALQLSAYPNPFNPVTRFRFILEDARAVDLGVFDLSGRKIRQLATGRMLPAGSHQFVWDGRDDQGRRQASGAYIGRLTTGSATVNRPITLLK